MEPKRVWVVEDDTVYRRMLSRVLNRSDEISECRVFPSCIEFFDALRIWESPDMVLMDLGLPEMSGVEGIQKLVEDNPEVSVVVLTVFSEKEKVFNALEAGASGYLLKSATGPEIIKGLQEVSLGGSALSPAVAKIVLEDIRKPVPNDEYKLATREIEVLEKLALGMSVKEIAEALSISKSTVSTYLERLYQKLQVQSQSGAVAKALRSGIIK